MTELSPYEFHRVITAYLQVGAVLVAAVALAVAMMKARLEKRNTLTTVAHEGLVKFIELNAKYPHLSLLEPEKRQENDLSPEDCEIERSAYMLLLFTYERIYRYARSTNQLDKLSKIENMIIAYGTVPRFLDARDLIISIADDNFAGKLNSLLEPNSTIK